jgi:hypothetical protein
MTVAMSATRQYRVMGVSVNNEFERMWKEKSRDLTEVPCRQMPEGTEKNQ